MVKPIDANSMQMSSSFKTNLQPATNHSLIIKKSGAKKEYIPWGDNNKYPADVLKDIRNHPSLQSILFQKGRLLYGYGAYLAKVVDEKDGFEKLTPLKDEKVQAFLDRSRFNQQIRIACLNYFRLENLFPELILTKNKKEVYSISYLKSAMCRWAEPTSKGAIEELLYNNSWGNGSNYNNSLKLKVLNELNPLDHLRDAKFNKSVYRSYGLDPEDAIGYKELSWDAIRTSNWLEVAREIPLFKKNLFWNQAAVKYHVQTTQEWWEWKYKGFMNMEQDERIKIMRQERSAFEEVMTGTDGAGKSLFTTGRVDRSTGKVIPGWKVETLSNKFGSDDYIEDMQEATSQILLSLNVPPTLVGQSYGKKMGAGSGSDIRESYNLYMAMQELERDIILEPWLDAFRYNGYSDEIRLVFRYPKITTLDEHTETKPIDHTNDD